MIRYSLICDKGHSFDSWFADSAAYDKQAKRGLVSCPQCGSDKVEKAIMAPRISGERRSGSPSETAADPVAIMSPQEDEFRTKLKEIREHIIKNSDDVGKKFPEEARKMHYGESEHRSIYGVATPEDAHGLAEEGIIFQPIPILPDERN